MLIDKSLLKHRLLCRFNTLPASLQNPLGAIARFIFRIRSQSREYKKMREILSRKKSKDVSVIEKYQLEMLKSIVYLAWNNSDGYRDYWHENGFSPTDLKRLIDIEKIPVITKDIMAKDIEYFSVRKKTRSAKYSTTSGSTGVPFGLYIDDHMVSIEKAFIHDLLSHFGYRLTDRTLILRGSAVHGGYNGSQNCEMSLKGQLYISSYTLQLTNVRDYEAAIKRFRPAYITAYPSSIEILTSFFVKAGIDLPHNMKFILCSSEVLSKVQKVLIERYWKCPVINLYGMVEKVVFAANCDGGGHLLTYPEYGITEVLDENNNPVSSGEAGAVVGTSFHMRQTPFIRYRLTDIAITEDRRGHSHGRTNCVIREVLGRERNFVRKKNGERIPFAMAVGSIHDEYLTAFQQFQFRQIDLGRINFRYVSENVVDQNVLERLRKDILGKIGAEFELEFQKVEIIERGPNGKYTYFVGLD